MKKAITVTLEMVIVAKGKKIGLYMSQAKVIKGEVNAIEDFSTNL